MPIRVYYEVLNQKGTPALYSDNYAQRPAAGYQGRIFNSPDTGQIFYDTGTTWTLLADAGVGSGSLASVCANGNTTATGISITAGGLSTNDFTNTGFASSVGYVWFAGTGGQMTGTQSFFWDNNNKWLGLGTNTPTAPFDIHTTGNIGIQINNTTTADSKIAFLNADVGKWRIGNLYSGGANLFHIYNNAGVTLAMQINSSNAALFYGSLSSNSFMQTNGGISLIHNATPTSAGYTGIGGLTAGLSIALASGFNQTLTFPTGVSYTYTFPSATGTLINASSFTTNYHPKYSSTAGVLTASMLTDDGTTLQSIGATRSNLYLQAANNTYYGQLAFTNGSNGSYGGLSYNNSGQYMQFETNSSEWARLLSDGSFLIGSTSNATGSPTFMVKNKSGAVANIAGWNFGGTTTSNDSNNNLLNVGAYYNGSSMIATNTTASGYQQYNGIHVFYTDSGLTPGNTYSNTERMRITAAGQLIIGNTSSLYTGTKLAVYQSSANMTAEIRSAWSGDVSTSALIVVKFDNNNTTSQVYQRFAIDNGNLTGGQINANGANQAAFGSWSDFRLKDNIENLPSQLNNILSLRPVEFDYKDGTGHQYGFIAQEMQEIYPDAVGTDENGFLTITGWSKTEARIVKAIQELNQKIENLN